MKTGLVSVTFRGLTPKEIIALCRKAKLDGIEWGADIHVKNVGDALAVKAQMEDLQTLSYGSYYRVGEGADFAPVLAAAKALGAPNIRVWAGIREDHEISVEKRASLVANAKQIAKMAAGEGIDVSFEYHGQTLTNTQASTLRLLQEIDEPNVYTYWQPICDRPQEERLAEIIQLGELGRLKNIHCYTWRGAERYPLEYDGLLWKQRLERAFPYADAALLEFVRDDSPEQFLLDAAFLRRIAAEIAGEEE